MANPSRGEALVRIDAGEFTLAFTLGACKAVEGQTGEHFNTVLQTLANEDPNFESFQTMVWAGLKKHHGMSMDEVEDLVTLADFPVWGSAITKCFEGGVTELQGTARPPKAKTKAT